MKKWLTWCLCLLLVCCTVQSSLIVPALGEVTATEKLDLGYADDLDSIQYTMHEGYYGDNRYALIEAGMTWHQAKDYCESLGGHLATVTSSGEQRFIEKLLAKGVRNNYWMGGYNQGGWKWVTGETFKYTHWSNGEPNNYLYQEYVMNIYRNGNPMTDSGLGDWNDLNPDGTCNNEPFFGTSNFGLICEWEILTEDNYIFKVVDQNGDPIEDALIAYDGDTFYTNEEGKAQFAYFSFDTPELTVSKSGYMTWTNAGSNWTKSEERLETIVLFPESASKLMLNSAQYSNFEGMSLSTNLLTNTKKISLGNSASLTGDLDFGNFYVKCSAYDTKLVASYQLWQGAKKIAESTDGSFKLNTESFAKGGSCFIRTMGKDGDYADTRINLTFEKAAVVEETNFSLASDSISVSVGDDVPFIGGSKLELKLPVNMPVTCVISDDKMQIGFNTNLAGGESDKEKWKELKKLCSDLSRLKSQKVGKLTGGQATKYKSFIKNTNKWKFFQNGELNFLGYAECDLGSKKASGVLILQGKVDAASFEFNTWCVVVPVTVQVELTLEGALSGTISYEWGSQTMDGALNFAPAATLTAFGGVGVSKLVGVGAYGSAKLESELEILPTPTVNSVDLTGELGLKAYLGLLTYEKPFAYNTWHLYTKNTARLARLLKDYGVDTDDMTADEMLQVLYKQLSQGMFDASQYKQADLSYLEEEVDRMGGTQTGANEAIDLVQEKDGDLRAEFATLIQNTYRNAQPVMVSTGDTLYAAFLRADAASGRVYTVVSKYDGTEWKTSVAAASENILDNTPTLLVDGSGGIWLAFARTEAGYDGSSLLSYATNQSIVVGTVDSDTLAFTQKKVYTGAGYVHMHQLSLVNGVPTLVWVDSHVTDDNSVLWPEKNAIYSAALSGESWVEPSLVHTVDNAVFEMAVGETDGTLSVAYIQDEDNSFETTGDQNLYIIADNNVTLAANGCSGSVTFERLPGTEGNAFIWNDGDTLRTSNGDTITLKGISGEYTITGDCIYFSAATDTGAELTVAKYDNGSWSVPITLTEGEGYFENLCVVTLNGVDYALGMYTSVEVGEETINDSKNLVWTKVTSVSDLQLGDVEYEPEGLTAGDAVPVTMQLTNAGDHTVEAYNVYLDGELLGTYTTALAAGESMELSVGIACPSKLTTYTISVCECDRIDYYPTNNEVEISIGYPDLSVEVQCQQIGEKSTVYATVTNVGVGAGSGKLTIVDAAGTVLGEKLFTDLTAGSSVIAMCEFDWSTTEERRMDVTAALVCEGDDLYDYNNTGVINLVYAGYRKDPTPDLMLPDALVEIGEEAFAGSVFVSVRVNEGAATIGSRAFADCDDLEEIVIPASVVTIADDAFEGTSGFVIYCAEGSAAQAFAQANEIVCIIE